jgi:hypothetical protein
MWQQATAPGTHTWEQALAYCENLMLNNDGLWTSGTANASGAKYDDWRLPTAKELASLVDSSRYNAAINILYFPDTAASLYWSSTTSASLTDYAWLVNFSGGLVNYYSKASIYSVRAVRSGQYGLFDDVTLWPVPDTGQALCYDSGAAIACPASGQPFYGQDASYGINTPAYTRIAAGGAVLPDTATSWDMVLDEVTGLVWEEKHAKDSVRNYADPNDADNVYTWYDNNSATNGGNAGTPGNGTDTMDFIRVLNAAHYGGFSDWRMPTVKELQSIVDYSIASPGPAINTTCFPNTVASGYLSSTTNAYDTSGAWIVGFSYGVIPSHSKAAALYVRAVRMGQYGLSGDLVISKVGAGEGTVASGDGKIDCGSDCSEKYSIGAQVTLTAAGAGGSTFTGWSGGGCTGTGQCVLTIIDNATMTVAANFDLIASTTTTTTSGNLCPAKKMLGESNSKLENLRYFRDSKLAHSAVGCRVIQIYYTNADRINAALERSPALREATRRLLEVIAPMMGR